MHTLQEEGEGGWGGGAREARKNTAASIARGGVSRRSSRPREHSKPYPEQVRAVVSMSRARIDSSSPPTRPLPTALAPPPISRGIVATPGTEACAADTKTRACRLRVIN
jgi:hypothetical protein